MRSEDGSQGLIGIMWIGMPGYPGIAHCRRPIVPLSAMLDARVL